MECFCIRPERIFFAVKPMGRVSRKNRKKGFIFRVGKKRGYVERFGDKTTVTVQAKLFIYSPRPPSSPRLRRASLSKCFIRNKRHCKKREIYFCAYRPFLSREFERDTKTF